MQVVLDVANVSSQPVRGPICAPGYAGIVLVDDQNRNYSVDTGTAELASAEDPYCTEAAQPGLGRKLNLVFSIPKAAVSSIGGVAIWDPTESGDEDGDSYYFVEARP